MAPVSNAVVGIDDDQRFALMKFRRSVRDILKPEHDDHFLLRWLRARQWDADASEKMLRNSMAWREKWGIDTTLATWKAPEILEMHFPSGSTGFDKEGSPVIIVPFAGLDVWGLLHTISRNDIIRLILRHLENYLSLARKQSQTHGEAAMKLTAIFDLEGFNMRQYAWRPAAEMVFTLLQMYEANYPEILKCCFIVNAPKVFSLAFSIIKKFMNEYTISKIKIYKTDPKKWQAHILKVIDKDQLPVHYGGSLVDDNGDPRCSLIVKLGGRVSKKYYTRKTSADDKDYTRVTIKTGEKHTVDLISAQPGCFLKWEFGIENHDIKFSICSRDEDGNETLVHGPRKVIGDGNIDSGVIPATGPATYTVTFDNSHSFIRSKKVFYNLIVTMPISELNISDLPDDGETASSSTPDKPNCQ